MANNILQYYIYNYQFYSINFPLEWAINHYDGTGGHYNVKSANIMAVNMEYSMNIVMIVNYSSITVNALQQNTVEKASRYLRGG